MKKAELETKGKSESKEEGKKWINGLKEERKQMRKKSLAEGNRKQER